MSDLPGWLDPLRDELPTLGFTWLDAETRQVKGETSRRTFEELPYDASFSAACRARAARSVAIAIGDVRTTRLGDRTIAMLLFYDRDQEALFVSLSQELPPPLWIPVGRDAAAISAALLPYRAASAPGARRFSRFLRLYRGTLEELGVTSIDELAGYIGQSESWLDTATWGSGCDNDPWPDDAAARPTIALRGLMARSAEQAPDQFPALSFRTMWSRSVLRLESHPFGAVIFELGYEPVAHPSIHAEFAAAFPGVHSPDDVPVDLLASILRGGSLAQPGIDQLLDTDTPNPMAVLAQCALAPADPGSAARVRQLLAHPSERPAALQLAEAYGMHGLRREVLAETEDEDERAQLMASLGPAEPEDEDEDAS